MFFGIGKGCCELCLLSCCCLLRKCIHLFIEVTPLLTACCFFLCRKLPKSPSKFRYLPMMFILGTVAMQLSRASTL